MKAWFSPTRLRMAGLVVLVLGLMVFVQAAFNLESVLNPSDPNQVVLFFSVSTAIFLVLTVFAFVLARNLFKLAMERRSEKPGSRFKTRLVMSMILLTLIPAVALFAFAFGLINRSIDKWFSGPIDRVFETTADIEDLWTDEHEAAARGIVAELASDVPADPDRTAANLGLEALALVDAEGGLVRASSGAEQYRDRFHAIATHTRLQGPRIDAAADGMLIGVAPSGEDGGYLAVVFPPPANLQSLAGELAVERQNYDRLREDRTFLRDIYMQNVVLMTILVLFAAV